MYEEALAAYNQAIVSNPNNGSAWHNKSIVLKELKRHDESLDAFDRAFVLDPNYPHSLYPDSANGWFNKGKALSDLIAAFDQVLALDPTHTEARVGVGNALIRFERYKEELAVYKHRAWVGISDRYPLGMRLFGKVTNITDYGPFVKIENGIEGLVHVSEMDWKNKNVLPNEVVTIGDELEVMILEIDELRHRISLSMKRCLPNPWIAFAEKHQKGDLVRGAINSITDFGIYIGLSENLNGLVHINDLSWSIPGEVAIRNFNIGDEIEALVLLIDVEKERIALGLKHCSPSQVDEALRHSEKGYELLKSKLHQEALAEFDRAISLDPNEGKYWVSKAVALKELKLYEEALAAAGQALAINPQSASAWDINGNVFWSLNRYEDALTAYNKSLSLEPNQQLIWSMKAITLQALKRYGESLAASDQALTLDPSCATTWLYKGKALSELKRSDEALTAFEKVLILDPIHTEAWFRKGNALLRLNRYEEALAAYGHAQPLDLGGGAVSYIRAVTLTKLKRYEEAISACDQALAIKSNYADAQQTKMFAVQELERQKATSTTSQSKSLWGKLWGK
jgi:tetratricopeptide (TPR) repeat protein